MLKLTLLIGVAHLFHLLSCCAELRRQLVCCGLDGGDVVFKVGSLGDLGCFCRAQQLPFGLQFYLKSLCMGNALVQ